MELDNLDRARKQKKAVEDDGSVLTCLQDYRCLCDCVLVVVKVRQGSSTVAGTVILSLACSFRFSIACQRFMFAGLVFAWWYSSEAFFRACDARLVLPVASLQHAGIVCVRGARRGGGGGGLLLPSAASEGCCDACGRWELQDEECVQAVLTSLEVAASDVRFAPKLADACFEDRHSFCSSVPPGSARVLGCLQEKCATALLLTPANILAPHVSPFNARGPSTSDDVKRRKLTARQSWNTLICSKSSPPRFVLHVAFGCAPCQIRFCSDAKHDSG